MDQAIISIYVPTFNHENYIVRALDSILMQQTRYSYEVFVGEDCSTDNTRQVLQEWEHAHADPRFTFLYRQQNMHRSPINNPADLKRRCKGKYIICLEGDDFWTDPQKLETQVAFLEAHPEYYAVAHNCTVVGADSEPNGEHYPQCTDDEYSFRHFASDILPGQFTTVLARNYMKDPQLDRDLITATNGAGDQKVIFSILCHGRIRCMQTSMSAYRHIVSGGSSFSATHHYSYDAQETYYRQFLLYAYRLDIRDAIACAEMLYLRTIRHAKRTGHIDATRAKADIKNLRKPVRARLLLLKRDINCRILHRTLHI